MDPYADRQDAADLAPTGGGIDRSVSYLLIGLVVIFFFFLTIFGMRQVERLSTQATSGALEPNAPPPTEIGGPGGEPPQ